MNKHFAGAGNQLSRAKMKSIVGGRPFPGGDDPKPCPGCLCEGGATALYSPAYGGSGCSGPVCYCPDDSRIYGASCPCL